MKRMFCDRCLADVTGKVSAAVTGVADATVEGNGPITVQVDLCTRCYRELSAWLKPTPIHTKRRR